MKWQHGVILSLSLAKASVIVSQACIQGKEALCGENGWLGDVMNRCVVGVSMHVYMSSHFCGHMYR